MLNFKKVENQHKMYADRKVVEYVGDFEINDNSGIRFMKQQ
jgi:hypothetical protein